MRGTLRGENKIRYVAAEPAACPTLTRGVYAYDFGDTVGPDAADADVHARPRLRPAAGARRRPALPRRLADGLRAGQGGRRRGARLPPERDLRGRRAVRPHRGDHPGARARARDPRGDRGGPGGQGGGRGAHDPVRALRPRQLRPRRLRRLPGGTLEDPEFSEDDLQAALDALPEARPRSPSDYASRPSARRQRACSVTVTPAALRDAALLGGVSGTRPSWPRRARVAPGCSRASPARLRCWRAAAGERLDRRTSIRVENRTARARRHDVRRRFRPGPSPVAPGVMRSLGGSRSPRRSQCWFASANRAGGAPDPLIGAAEHARAARGSSRERHSRTAHGDSHAT